MERGFAGSIYGIGSVSKMFTAAAVMKLSDEGLLDLDAPLVRYIPDFTMADARYREITPRMLLNHSSGLMGSTGINTWLLNDYSPKHIDGFLASLQFQRLKHEPGAFSMYCNDGFTLAEILVERVSGKGFTEYLEEQFFLPLGLDDTMTPASIPADTVTAPIYHNGMEFPLMTLNDIGSGGMYSSAVDLCRFGAIFTDDPERPILSEASVSAMASSSYRGRMEDRASDSVIDYGLGWDSVSAYPFNRLGITALSKGGDVQFYHGNLTVLPEYNLTAAVVSSGENALEQIIAQEILLAVLEELIPLELKLPQELGAIRNSTIIEGFDTAMEAAEGQGISASVPIPPELLAYAGIYNNGKMIEAAFSGDRLLLTPLGTRTEGTQIYLHTGAGVFVSTGGDFIFQDFETAAFGTTGRTAVEFKLDGQGTPCLMVSTYKDWPGIGQTAMALPLAEKIEANPVPEAVADTWHRRTAKDWLLVSEKYTSAVYAFSPVLRIAQDGRVPGYISQGIYRNGGVQLKSAFIRDAFSALGFQDLPGQIGRDINDITASTENSIEYLTVNGSRYMAADGVPLLFGGSAGVRAEYRTEIRIERADHARWFRTESGPAVEITVSPDGAFFIFDEYFNCVGTSHERERPARVFLPEKGYVVFVGEVGSKGEVRR
jgi:CubicO group peptidase (beta-lactamase class C family)